ncbi:MAG: C40 family peptidase [Pseudobutyrivibrio sp.]|nr:C40 family peptidase [Pseudobutyrivibrio sp.]
MSDISDIDQNIHAAEQDAKNDVDKFVVNPTEAVAKKTATTAAKKLILKPIASGWNKLTDEGDKAAETSDEAPEHKVTVKVDTNDGKKAEQDEHSSINKEKNTQENNVNSAGGLNTPEQRQTLKQQPQHQPAQQQQKQEQKPTAQSPQQPQQKQTLKQHPQHQPAQQQQQKQEQKPTAQSTQQPQQARPKVQKLQPTQQQSTKPAVTDKKDLQAINEHVNKPKPKVRTLQVNNQPKRPTNSETKSNSLSTNTANETISVKSNVQTLKLTTNRQTMSKKSNDSLSLNDKKSENSSFGKQQSARVSVTNTTQRLQRRPNTYTISNDNSKNRISKDSDSKAKFNRIVVHQASFRNRNSFGDKEDSRRDGFVNSSKSEESKSSKGKFIINEEEEPLLGVNSESKEDKRFDKSRPSKYNFKSVRKGIKKRMAKLGTGALRMGKKGAAMATSQFKEALDVGGGENPEHDNKAHKTAKKVVTMAAVKSATITVNIVKSIIQAIIAVIKAIIKFIIKKVITTVLKMVASLIPGIGTVFTIINVISAIVSVIGVASYFVSCGSDDLANRDMVNEALSSERQDELIKERKVEKDSYEEKVLKFALSKVGLEYSQDPNERLSGEKYDCSSLVYALEKELGYELPTGASFNQAEKLMNEGKCIYSPDEGDDVHWTKAEDHNHIDLQIGDLVYYGGDDKNEKYKGIHHVAIYIGNGRVVEAYGEDEGVILANMKKFDEKNTYIFRPQL